MNILNAEVFWSGKSTLTQYIERDVTALHMKAHKGHAVYVLGAILHSSTSVCHLAQKKTWTLQGKFALLVFQYYIRITVVNLSSKEVHNKNTSSLFKFKTWSSCMSSFSWLTTQSSKASSLRRILRRLRGSEILILQCSKEKVKWRTRETRSINNVVGFLFSLIQVLFICRQNLQFRSLTNTGVFAIGYEIWLLSISIDVRSFVALSKCLKRRELHNAKR